MQQSIYKIYIINVLKTICINCGSLDVDLQTYHTL